ncbi:U-box domain-containing protein 3 [Morella rubra]|uniref:RING-type E3 ubiquitin transferase n=1 Tax=Morella rubra TaxID=262757 RepID=A0A6A1WET0_9ROSI|nr:U-box domain-containing protein 3 [Morella rubra]
MDTASVKCLINSISRFIHLVSCQTMKTMPIQTDYRDLVSVLKLLKAVLDEVVENKIPSDEILYKECEELDMTVNETREFIETWSPKTSKICSVLQSAPLLVKIRSSSLEICHILCRLLQSSPCTSSLTSVQRCVQELEHLKVARITENIGGALKSQSDDIVHCRDHLVKIIELLSLTSHQELLKECISVEKEIINAQVNKDKGELDQLYQIANLVSHIRDHMVKMGQFEATTGVVVPSYFRCPLSSELMLDPVILASGQTYERSSIQKWLDHGLAICPKTRQTLTHTNIIPNYTVKAMIANWIFSLVMRKRFDSATTKVDVAGNGNHNYFRASSLPFLDSGSDEETGTSHVKKLIEDLKNQSSEVNATAAEELRLLAKDQMHNRIIIGQCGAIAPLLSLLYSESKVTQEHAVTALLNLSINADNKAMIAEAGAIEPLIHVLKTGNDGAKENSAAALFSLSQLEEYKAKIGRSGAVKALVDLLRSGTLRGKKDAATALFNLSIFHENKARIVQAGAVKHLVELMDPASGMVDKAIALLANLSTIGEGRLGIVREGGIPLLVEIVESGSKRGNENAASILLQLCLHSPKYCTLVLQEGAVPPLVALAQSGTPRAKEKAQQLLCHFRNQREGAAGKGKP